MHLRSIKSAGSALTAGGLIAVAVVACGATNPCDGYMFPSQAWKTRSPETRGVDLATLRKAADALVDCGVIDGATKREVRALLGWGGPLREDEWTYSVGIERGPIPIDHETLTIRFLNGHVRDVLHGES